MSTTENVNRVAPMFNLSEMETDHQHASDPQVDADVDRKSATHVEVTEMEVFGHAEHVQFTAAEGRKVLWKIDLILLPLLCGCYVFSVSLAAHPHFVSTGHG